MPIGQNMVQEISDTNFFQEKKKKKFTNPKIESPSAVVPTFATPIAAAVAAVGVVVVAAAAAAAAAVAAVFVSVTVVLVVAKVEVEVGLAALEWT
jgi:small neutral amino acid transporter SnatA (MarC family)